MATNGQQDDSFTLRWGIDTGGDGLSNMTQERFDQLNNGSQPNNFEEERCFEKLRRREDVRSVIAQDFEGDRAEAEAVLEAIANELGFGSVEKRTYPNGGEPYFLIRSQGTNPRSAQEQKSSLRNMGFDV